MYSREEVAIRILDLFFVRKDVYARSFIKSDGTMYYAPSCSCSLTCNRGTGCPLWSPHGVTETTIYDHILATTLEPYPRTVGSYSTSQNQESCWIVFDIDAHNAIKSASIVDPRDSIAAYQTLTALSQTLKDQHIPHYVEESGMGWHIWVFVSPIRAEVAYRAGRQILDMTEDCATDVEVYPKQSTITENGFGNLVKVPYGLHWSGRRCVFIDLETKKYIQDQWEYLFSIKKVEPMILQRLAGQRISSLKSVKKVEDIRKANIGLQSGLLPGPPCVLREYRRERNRDGSGHPKSENGGRVPLQHSVKAGPALWPSSRKDP